MKKRDFSVIIPQRNSIHTLPRLFNSIPASDRIEIILVDNSPTPVTKEEIGIEREYTLLWAAPERYAGGARNVGIENAHGKWLLFADADDFFLDGAFDVFYSSFNSDAEVIYYGTEMDEKMLRLHFPVPWSKMVRGAYVDKHTFRFDEVIAGNDVFFSLLIGYYADHVAVVDKKVYVKTIIRGSLTMRRNLDILKSKYIVRLRRNLFLREHGLSNEQKDVIFFIGASARYGFRPLLMFLWLAFSYKQNLLIGIGGWMSTYKNNKEKRKKISHYIVAG